MKTGRRLRRFLSNHPLPGVGGLATLPSRETRHLRKTLRLKVGDRCLVTDGGGREAEATIAEFLKTGETRVKIEDSREAPKESSLRFWIGQGLLQRGVMDDLIRKAQELGVTGVWPIETERSMKLAAGNQFKTLARWRKIAAEATKQSGSLQILEIAEPQKLNDIVKKIDPKQPVIFFHPHGEGISFKDWVSSLNRLDPVRTEMFRNISHSAGSKSLSLTLFFGPEGGFSEKEIKSAVEVRTAAGGAKPVLVKLGPNILKADTAFLGAASALRFLFS